MVKKILNSTGVGFRICEFGLFYRISLHMDLLSEVLMTNSTIQYKFNNTVITCIIMHIQMSNPAYHPTALDMDYIHI